MISLPAGGKFHPGPRTTKPVVVSCPGMNTARSVWMGWATLMVAGAGAYYFAKRDIDAHRREQELKGLRGTEFLECKSPTLCSPFLARNHEERSFRLAIIAVLSLAECRA